MYRTYGESNNNMSHFIRRSYGSQLPQLSLENSSTIEEQCMRDDRYFNLLYKTYDNSSHHHGITHRINHLSNIDHFNVSRNTFDLNRTEIDKAWRSTLVDYRQMDAELAHIQRDCEVIENNLARVEMAAQNDKLLKDSDVSNLDLNLVGSALATINRSSPRLSGLNINSPLSTLFTDSRPSHNNSGTTTEYTATYQLPTIAELVRDSNAHVPQQDHKTFDQELRKQIETNSGSLPKSNTEPYRCPVCWNCVRQRKPASTICGHVFCSGCIKTALRTTCKCPVCQRLMTTRQVFRIYI